jgi:hypothetical protein
MFVTKVVLGNVRRVSRFAEVSSCPAGSQSVSFVYNASGRSLNVRYVQVEFNRMNGELNETVVYTNNAIRPVFLIVFG